MALFWTWITTIIVSKTMNYITIGRIFRDIYSSGYKINFKKFIEMSNNLDINKANKLRQYILFLNIFDSINMGMGYLNDPNSVINFFFINDSLDEMTNEEKKMYEEKPGFIRAMYISALSDEKEKEEEIKNSKFRDSIKVLYKDKGDTSISFNYIPYNNKIRIDKINVVTDVILNRNSKEYKDFIVSKILESYNIPTIHKNKNRLIKALKRINKKDNVDIIEERINLLEEEKKIENNSKPINYSNTSIRDVSYDKDYNMSEKIDSMIEEKEEKPMSLTMKRRK